MIEKLQSKIKNTFKSIFLPRKPERKKQVSKEQKKQNLQLKKESELQSLIDSGLPEEMKPCLYFLVKGTTDRAVETVAQEVEQRREEIASEGSKEVEIWFSPAPVSAGYNSDIETRHTPGEIGTRTMEKIASTGKNRRWGIVLYLLARSFKTTTVFELGSCAGISAHYLSFAPSINKLITVEGSCGLARIAGKTLSRFKGKCRVVNSRFDDAIDDELPKLDRKIDLAYIDGHHEKNATIHYFHRLLPYLAEKALVIFDDISWSDDMREAWDILRKRAEFSHAIDLGVIGVCILQDRTCTKTAPKNWDLRPIIGTRRTGTNTCAEAKSEQGMTAE